MPRQRADVLSGMAAPMAARAAAVKVGRCAGLAAYAEVDRPHLDGGEHDAMLRASRIDRGQWLTIRVLYPLLRTTCGSIRCAAAPAAEHERAGHLAAPSLQTSLHCAHQAVGILPRIRPL